MLFIINKLHFLAGAEFIKNYIINYIKKSHNL